MNNEFKKATERPWVVATPLHSWPSVIAETPNNGKPFTNIVKSDCSISYGDSTTLEAAKDNCALIVEAVNSFEALNAVAEAAQLAKEEFDVFANMSREQRLEMANLPSWVRNSYKPLSDALAALQSLRAGKGDV